eukprot:CAMPEP_0114139352 /NCGR_PEP_ID=MMETSP0043_2-20121206/16807_1 /TAXON_ID=464988 /ORGANISM="Hemiselmis andersenii, Strain CCMP644" /LENGTH=100 /DNA_ID=CAMNT_0001233377 /DNA_START=632 /DNA_END=935 /DNA_ORIENTATION=+
MSLLGRPGTPRSNGVRALGPSLWGCVKKAQLTDGEQHVQHLEEAMGIEKHRRVPIGLAGCGEHPPGVERNPDDGHGNDGALQRGGVQGSAFVREEDEVQE